MNRFDQLPQDLKIKIYEYNADHRPQWKDVMRDLIMYDGDLLMEFLYEHRHDFMYDQAKEIEGYYWMKRIYDKYNVPDVYDIKLKIVKSCKYQELARGCSQCWHDVSRYTYYPENPYECIEMFYRFKELPYKKPHVVTKYNVHPDEDTWDNTIELYESCQVLYDVYHAKERALDRDGFVVHFESYMAYDSKDFESYMMKSFEEMNY